MRILLPLIVVALAVPATTRAAENISVPAFRSIELRGGGAVTLVPGPVQRVTIISGSSEYTHIYVKHGSRLRIDACNRQCPRNYPLQIRIESPTVPILAVEGGGKISTARGFAAQPQLIVAADSGGEIDAREVPAAVVTAAVQGGGEIKVQALRTLTGAVCGGGSIRYWGSPAVTTAIDGGGSVRRGY
jgi:hypothetical protein